MHLGRVAKSMPLWGTCVALVTVMSISGHLILIFTPMHFSYSNKSIHYLNQDKHIYQDAHREKCIGVSAEHASAGTRVLSASTRVPEHLSYGKLPCLIGKSTMSMAIFKFANCTRSRPSVSTAPWKAEESTSSWPKLCRKSRPLYNIWYMI